jgi:Winged helix DNA-binding domain
MADATLSQRQLNRALLARQGLLERSPAAASDVIERLVAMQAQEPFDPYVALWSRVEGFDPAELGGLIERREAVRATSLRATVHLHTAADVRRMQPLTERVRTQSFKGAFRRTLGDADVGAIAAAGRELLEVEPLTRAEIGRRLADRWPDVPPATLGNAVAAHLALMQLPPRGVWGRTRQATLALTERELGQPLEPDPSIEQLVLRYLTAFGPAAGADVRIWSRITGLKPVLERLRPDLRSYRDERGRELLDVPDGLFVDPDTPAPPRFLPEYDNVLLGHDDRSRVLAGLGPGLPYPCGRWIGQLLVDGFYRAYWNLVEADGVATLTIDRFTPHRDDPPKTRAAIEAEGQALIALIAPDAVEARIVFEPAR